MDVISNHSSPVPDIRTICNGKRSTTVFDKWAYGSDNSTLQLHNIIKRLAAAACIAEPTLSHRFIAHLNDTHRLLRNYDQNIDNIPAKIKSISPDVSPSGKESIPKTILLHGRLDRMICEPTRQHCFAFEPNLFHGSYMPTCPECEKSESQRQLGVLKLGKANLRPHGVGVLRPDITLYEDYGLDNYFITAAQKKDLGGTGPDCVIIMGTRLCARVPGARRLALEFCRAAKANSKKGLIIYVNDEQPSLGSALNGLIDYRVSGDCDLFSAMIEEVVS
jgi:NAD-dependent histone deacetylase SIR2